MKNAGIRASMVSVPDDEGVYFDVAGGDIVAVGSAAADGFTC